MNVKILEISLGARRFGKLFQYADLCRFVAEPELVAAPPPEVLSLSMVASDPSAQSALWSDVKNPLFNAQGGQLPRFFQNLLPEGVLRSHIAQLRGCRENDHFELLAACGGDLPGAVSARPVSVDRSKCRWSSCRCRRASRCRACSPSSACAGKAGATWPAPAPARARA
nr:HipA N-terminal domain-containing protein [Variovorax paradoxus]